MKKQKLITTLSLLPLLFSCGEQPVTTPATTTQETTTNTQPVEEKYKPEYTIDDADMSLDANDSAFNVSTVKQVEDHLLGAMTFLFLGSSVTYGASSQGVAMAEYLSAKTGAKCLKEAVSGTTLYVKNEGDNSYVNRLLRSTAFKKEKYVDAFICQISTNDARNEAVANMGVHDGQKNTATTLGAVEFIIEYVKETWDCPIYFYSGSYFADEGKRKNTNPTGTNYGTLVNNVKEIVKDYQGKGYDCGVIDMFYDEAFNSVVSDEFYSWSTSDPIHPKKAGYLHWWMPYFEAYLLNHLF